MCSLWMIKVKKKKMPSFFQFPAFILSGIIPMKDAYLAVIGNKISVTANIENTINWAEFAGSAEKSSFRFSHITANETQWQ